MIMTDKTHVYPRNNLREHVINGDDCWCRPETQYEGLCEAIIHNAMDQRELIETGERMIQ